MAKTSAVTTIAADPDQTWQVATDLSRFEEWLTLHHAWVKRPPKQLWVGVKATEMIEVMTLTNDVEWTVDTYEPGRLQMSGKGGYRLNLGLEVAAWPEDGGTTVEITIEFSGILVRGPVVAMIENSVRQQLETSLAALSGVVADSESGRDADGGWAADKGQEAVGWQEDSGATEAVDPATNGQTLKELLELEEQGWEALAAGTAGEFYRAHLTDDALMILPPPAGMLDGDTAATALSKVPTWDEHRVSDARLVRLGANTAVVMYRAHARRGDADPYEAMISSTYVKNGGGHWRLATHQHTPLG